MMKENITICHCKQVTVNDIETALHQHTSLGDVEQEFQAVQELTHCSTGCGGCMDKIKSIISDFLNGTI